MINETTRKLYGIKAGETLGIIDDRTVIIVKKGHDPDERVQNFKEQHLKQINYKSACAKDKNEKRRIAKKAKPKRAVK